MDHHSAHYRGEGDKVLGVQENLFPLIWRGDKVPWTVAQLKPSLGTHNIVVTLPGSC